MKLQTKNLSVVYPQQSALTYPDFSIHRGDQLLIKGRSGVGKTTFLLALTGILPLHSGDIWIDDLLYSELPQKIKDQKRNRYFGLIFQEPKFISALTVVENLKLAQRFCPHKPHSIDPLLEQLNLTSVARKKIDEISTGERQRVAIARALIQKPAFIIADEPTSALDDHHCNLVLSLLKNTAKTLSAGLIIVTHDHRLDASFDHQITLQ